LIFPDQGRNNEKTLQIKGLAAKIPDQENQNLKKIV